MIQPLSCHSRPLSFIPAKAGIQPLRHPGLDPESSNINQFLSVNIVGLFYLLVLGPRLRGNDASVEFK